LGIGWRGLARLRHLLVEICLRRLVNVQVGSVQKIRSNLEGESRLTRYHPPAPNPLPTRGNGPDSQMEV
jgi:hypothetical protein